MLTPHLAVFSHDVLTPLAQELLTLNSAHAYEALVVSPSGGDAQAQRLLNDVSPGQLLNRPAARADEATGMLCGLWLWHDWLEPSHRLAQSLGTSTGNFWHAIMHRREGDFSNSKYWYARCVDHPMLATMASYAASILDPLPADNSLLRLTRGGWSPSAYVDLVESLHSRASDPRHLTLISLQQLEWRLLFEHCLRSSLGEI